MDTKEIQIRATLFAEDPFKKIENLKQSVKNRLTRNALRRTLLDLKNTVKANAPKDTGSLRMSIGIKVGTKKNTTWGRVGPRMSYSKVKKGRMKTPFRYAGPLARGHGKALANNFFAVSFNRTALIEKMRTAIEQGIQKELAKRDSVPF